MKRRVGFLAVCWLFVGASAFAAVTPSPGPGDPRYRVVRYDPDQVVSLRATFGYQLAIEFGEGERIENVSIGDSLAWQVTPNRKANILFLKPVERAAPTNMTVVTNLRRYGFDLSAGSAKRAGVVFGLRFEYPEPITLVAEPAPEVRSAPPRDLNHAYSYAGVGTHLPTRVFDDGRSTYFTFAEDDAYPAIFAVEANGAEASVNIAIRDGYVVVDQVARGFVLRHGTELTRLFNDGYPETGPGPLSPTPRQRQKGKY